jgi:hypothetical protein
MDKKFNTGAFNLEREFFYKEDQKLIQKLREMKQMQETREALAQVSGINNETVLNRLVELQVRPETVAALALVPLIEVAWADGNLDEKERMAVLQATDHLGSTDSNADRVLLEEWLKQKPDPKLMDAWLVYIQGLCQELGATEINLLKQELVGHARQIAEASGGLLGLTKKISSQEEDALARIEKAFA